jgi:signal transduction histidine kinase
LKLVQPLFFKFSVHYNHWVGQILMAVQLNRQPTSGNREFFLETLKNFSIALDSIPDLKSLAKQILETMVKTMVAQTASLFLLNKEKGGFHLVESIDSKVRMSPSSILAREDPLFQELLKRGDILLRDELVRAIPSSKEADLSERMSLLEAAISIPLILNGNLNGMICLGSKSPPDTYTHEDVEFLSILAYQSANALENRRLTEDLKKSKSHMQRADRLASLGTLTAALAHEIRNPLVAIKTFTQLLPERFDDEEFRNHFLHIVSGEVDRISTLINELLEFARPSDPKVEAEDVNTILDSIILLVSSGTKKKHIHINKDFPPNLPPVPIDREQMKQVFLNILINAIEATAESGKICVKTRPYIKSNGDPYIQIEFTDTGCGIPAEYLENIFNPFFTTKHTGSGLGLSISNQIVQEHKGYIDVESQLNNGSSFYVNLPLHRDKLPRKREFGKQ